LEDVIAMQLQNEDVVYIGNKDPKENLRDCGATEEECGFLVRERQGGGWVGKRVELNAMTSAQFLDFLERKLAEVMVCKLVPDDQTLLAAYRRAFQFVSAQKALDAALRQPGNGIPGALPDDMADKIRAAINGSELPWDEVLWRLVSQGGDFSETQTGNGNY
jgi:hypothetical protein